MTTAYSAFPWERVPRMTRAEARLASQLARWLAASPQVTTHLTSLFGGPVRAHQVSLASSFDPYAARCVVRVGGASLEVLASSMGVRAIAQRLLGGPDELAAPRPLSAIEQSLWALVVATAVEDLAIDAHVWAMPAPSSPSPSPASPAPVSGTCRLALELSAGSIDLAIELYAPPDLALRAPPARPVPPWADRTQVDVPIVLGRCVLAVAALDRLRVRDLVTLEAASGSDPRRRGRAAELDLLGGTLGVIVQGVGASGAGGGERGQGRPPGAEPGCEAVVAEVVRGYVPRAVSVPDDAAHVELTVGLGTTQLSLRQVFDLAIGQIIPLGRPLAGPFELRAQGRVVGSGELVDVDGELAVRIVSVAD